MSTTTSAPDAALLHAGTALIPSPHDVPLAAASRPTLGALAQTTGDLTLTVTGEGGATGKFASRHQRCGSCSRRSPRSPAAMRCHYCRSMRK